MRKLLAALVVFSIVEIATLGRSTSDLKGPPAEQALRLLLDGNERYLQHRPLHPDSLPSDAPQHPLAVIRSP